MATTLPAAADVVVIGGGVMGCSTAYHLAKFGAGEVLLLEREQLTSGTSWHSAALVRQLRSSRNLTETIKYSAALYASLEAETGLSTGWLKTGSLSIATHADRLTHIKRQASLAQAFDVETHVIDAAEAGRLWPLMRTDDIVGAVFSPDDGRVNPTDLCAALAKGARNHGAQIAEGVRVTGFEQQNGRIAAVVTSAGRIECRAVALCAGLWSRELALLAGVAAPLHACEHFYLLTKPIDGIDGHLPTLSYHDGYLYIRDDVGGLLVGCFEPNPKALPLEALPENFAFDLLNEDWDHFEPMMQNALHRIPALETAEARMLLNGPESFTPDERFLLGEAPELGGFFLGCGMNSVGMASGGGAGKALAEWIIEGRPTTDLWPVDIRRFAPFQNNLKSLRERIPEVLGIHYTVAYPGREFDTARDLRVSPLHEAFAAKGARFGQRMGWERPNWFAPEGREIDETPTFGRPGWFDCVAAEHRAAREAVALFDQTSFAKLLIRGADAECFLQRVCANDVAVPPGRIVYTGLLNERGGYESDLTVQRLSGDAFMLITGAGQVTRDADWLRRQMTGEERLALTDVSGAEAVITVTGPRARELMQRVSPSDLSNEAFPYYTWQTLEIGYGTARAARLSYAGELGWELYVATDLARNVYAALVEAGADLGLTLGGSYALTSLRVEKAYRAWGHDLSPEETPFEAGLGFAVKLDKQIPFVGREALLRQRDAGVERRFMIFMLDDPGALPHGGEPIWLNGEIVGETTIGTFGHTLGQPLAMGYVRLNGRSAAQVAAESGFEIDIALDRYRATATLNALYDPNGVRVKG